MRVSCGLFCIEDGLYPLPMPCSAHPLTGAGHEFEHHHGQDDAAHERLGLQPPVAVHAAEVLQPVVAVLLASAPAAAGEHDDHLCAHRQPADDAQDCAESAASGGGQRRHRDGGHHDECHATSAQQSEALLCADQAAPQAQHQAGQPGTGPRAGGTAAGISAAAHKGSARHLREQRPGLAVSAKGLAPSKSASPPAHRPLALPRPQPPVEPPSTFASKVRTLLPAPGGGGRGLRRRSGRSGSAHGLQCPGHIHRCSGSSRCRQGLLSAADGQVRGTHLRHCTKARPDHLHLGSGAYPAGDDHHHALDQDHHFAIENCPQIKGRGAGEEGGQVRGERQSGERDPLASRRSSSCHSHSESVIQLDHVGLG